MSKEKNALKQENNKLKSKNRKQRNFINYIRELESLSAQIQSTKNRYLQKIKEAKQEGLEDLLVEEGYIMEEHQNE